MTTTGPRTNATAVAQYSMTTWNGVPQNKGRFLPARRLASFFLSIKGSEEKTERSMASAQIACWYPSIIGTIDWKTPRPIVVPRLTRVTRDSHAGRSLAPVPNRPEAKNSPRRTISPKTADALLKLSPLLDTTPVPRPIWHWTWLAVIAKIALVTARFLPWDKHLRHAT
jgi:hypothetical protein